MAKITISEVESLAKLARLGLTEDEKATLATQMSEILNYANKLEELDVSKVVPTSQVTGLVNIFREDAIVDCELTNKELLTNAPETEGEYIKVAKVL